MYVFSMSYIYFAGDINLRLSLKKIYNGLAWFTSVVSELVYAQISVRHFSSYIILFFSVYILSFFRKLGHFTVYTTPFLFPDILFCLMSYSHICNAVSRSFIVYVSVLAFCVSCQQVAWYGPNGTITRFQWQMFRGRIDFPIEYAILFCFVSFFLFFIHSCLFSTRRSGR